MLTLLGGLLAIIEPALPLFYICIAFVCLDCWSAWQLSKRVAKKYPDKTGKDGGKFRSDKMRHVVLTTVPLILLGLVLAHWAQVLIVQDAFPINMPRILAGGVCGWQFWSFLENTASCDGPKWAAILRKYTIDKTERHFDIDLTTIKKDDEDTH